MDTNQELLAAIRELAHAFKALIKTNETPDGKQTPGCLPRGYDLDSMLTVDEFAVWQQVAASTARASVPSLKGVVRRSRQWVRIHPRTFLEKMAKR